jgi:hypothetical protein
MSGVSGLPVVPQYLAIAADEQTYVQRAEKSDTTTQAQIAYFKAEAPTITSPTALLANYRVLQVVLGAFGMSADINDTGLLKELMTQNPQSSSSLAKTLASPIDLRFAQAFSNWTTSPLSSSAQGYVFSGTTASAAQPGATTLQLTSVAGLQLGQSVTDTTSAAALAGGTLISAINTATNTITLSGATAAAVGKGDTLSYGTPQFIAAAPALTGSSQLTLGSTSGVAVGDYLTSINGAAPITSGAGPKITAISGNTITLSAGLPSSVSTNGTLTFAPAPIASVSTVQAAGSATLQLTSLTGVRIGQLVSATGGTFSSGTTVTAIDAANNTVTLSHSLAAATTPAEQITFTDIPTTISNPASTISSQFETNAFEQSEGTTSGLQQALYFTRTIASSTTLAQMMSDPTQLQVLEVATGQPAAFGELDYSQQVAILTKDVDVSKFSNAAYVTQYVERYLVLNQISPPAPPTTYSIATLFGGSGSSSGSSSSGILSLFG